MPINPLSSRRLPDAVQRRLEVASAMAWEALVESHARHALQFISLLADRLPFDEAVDRYLDETDVAEAVATAVRTRVLVALEDAERDDASRPTIHAVMHPADEDGSEEVGGWRRFRPDVVMRGVKERHRRHEETERWIQLALARAEEGIIAAHVDNAITFVALLDPHMDLDRAVETYLDAMDLTGARAQGVLQRTLARLAEVRLPTSPDLELDGEAPPAGAS